MCGPDGHDHDHDHTDHDHGDDTELRDLTVDSPPADADVTQQPSGQSDGTRHPDATPPFLDDPNRV